MTDKKDLTSIHDLAEFEHLEDSDVDAQLIEDDAEKSSIGDLDEASDSNFDEFEYSAEEEEENTSEDYFSSTDTTDPDISPLKEDSLQFDSEEISETDEVNLNDNLEEDPETDDYISEDQESDLNDFSSDEEDSEISGFLDDEEETEFSSEEISEFPENEESNENINFQTEENDFELDSPITSFEENENDFDSMVPELDQNPVTEVEETLSPEMSEGFEHLDSSQEQGVDSLEDYPLTNNYDSPAISNAIPQSQEVGSLQTNEVVKMTAMKMSGVANNMTDNVPEIPRINSTFSDFKQEVVNLSYAPSPEATGPLYAIQIRGDIQNYQDHIQSLLDEYQVAVQLRDEAYQGPVRAGFIQITRINEYIAIQLTIGLSKYGLSISTHYLEDIIAADSVDSMEGQALQSEFNLPQNLEDQAEFSDDREWPVDEVLITTTSGPSGHKALKRFGLIQKVISVPRNDYDNLQVNFKEFFSDDLHLSGSSTLLDGLIKKIHDDLKEEAANQGANCIVNFNLEQRTDFNMVTLHFTGDLLFLRKLK